MKWATLNQVDTWVDTNNSILIIIIIAQNNSMYQCMHLPYSQTITKYINDVDMMTKQIQALILLNHTSLTNSEIWV